MSAKWLVSYRRDGEVWEASVFTVPGCHVQGETKAEAKSRVKEALLLFFDTVDSRDIEDAPAEHPLRPILREDGKKGVESVGNLIRSESKPSKALPHLDNGVYDSPTITVRRHRRG